MLSQTKVLLDTNIIIHREAAKVVNPGIGKLFNWLDKLGYIKCIDPISISEIEKHKDQKVVETMKIKISNYFVLKTRASLKKELELISSKIDKNINDINDTLLLNELFSDRVDMLITEDANIHKKSALIGMEDKVYTIENFLEKVNSENPGFVSYKTLSVESKYFGNIDIEDKFFDSFRRDYIGFNKWFNRKSDEIAYVCYEDNQIIAFLYVKREDENENYSSIDPQFNSSRRLKIGTFKVTLNGFKIGERFLKIIFDNAIIQQVQEIYVTLFNKTQDQQRLIRLLIDWGFQRWGTKTTSSGDEIVLVRDFRTSFNELYPRLTFPFFDINKNTYLVAIYPQYHTELFPDSILKTENPLNFIDNEPYRNSISKVYISRSPEKNLRKGDIIIFYRTGNTSPKLYSSVITTIGLVESVKIDIQTEQQFISLCRKRSVFTDEELSAQWNYNKINRPFIVNFLYTYSFPKRVTLKELIEIGVLTDPYNAPRGFTKISKQKLKAILDATHTPQKLIVD